MIGVIVVSHSNIGKDMLAATKKIVHDCTNIECVAIESDLSPEGNRSQIQAAIAKVDQGDGVLLLADMFGGTPSNLCLSFLEKGKVDIISGFNLPMLIKLASSLKESKFDEFASFIKQYGQKNIVIASEVLDGKIDYS